MIHAFTFKGNNIVLDVYSGAVHVLDDAAFNMIRRLSPPLADKCPQGLIADKEIYDELLELYKSGQLFSEDDYGELASSAVLSPIKAMCLNVSHDCNLRCAYCFAGKGDYSQGREIMSLETAKKAVDFLIAQSKDRQNLEIDFFGGEPLLNFEVVKNTVAYARSKEAAHNKRFRFTITTNGLMLDDDKIAFINNEMSNIVLSLDGRREVNDRVRARVDGSGCFDAVVPKFQKLIAAREDKEYYVRGTFTRHNLDFASDVAEMHRLGFDQVSIEPVVAPPHEPYALTQDDLPDILSEYEKLADMLLDLRSRGEFCNFFHFMIDLSQGPCAIKRLRGCGCANEYVAITPGGDIYPCHQFIGHKSWKMGSLHDSTFDLKSKKRFAEATVYQKSDCRECWAKFYCSGGCNANNMLYMGDIKKPLPLSCAMEKKRLECAIALKAAQMDL